MPPVQLGIIGAGRAARELHAPALAPLRSVIHVAAVADLDPRRAQWPGARSCRDVDSLLAHPGLEAVAILTPPATHAALALRALRAGHHVFVEKPLATTPEDAAAIVDAARAAHRIAAVGHQLRLHRFVRRAKAAGLGRLREIHAAWCSPGSAGDLVLDLGVHHIDLARFLTGEEFADLSGAVDPDGATVRARGTLTGGAVFTAVWSNRPHAGHTIRLIGTEATVEFSPYGALTWRRTPRRLSDTVADTIHALRGFRSGGDPAASYRDEWRDFAAAIRAHRSPACPAEEAAKNVAACCAIDLRRPQPAPAHPPVLSVILGAHGPFASVRHTVRHLRAQTISGHLELILLFAHDSDPAVPPGALDGFFSSTIRRIPAASSVAQANAAGVRLATAPVVAFAEDHCFPEPGWAAALVDAHRGPYAAVGPEIAIANPGSVVAWCDFLIGYGPWMSPARAGEAPFLPGHNSSYKREVLLAYGGQLEHMLEAETVLHFDLVRQGRRLLVEPRARAAHLNFALWRVWLPMQFHGGRVFAASRAAAWPWWRKALYAGLSPLIPAVRLLRCARELLQPGRPRHQLPRLLPALATGLVCDGAGQAVGYLAGAGRSPLHVARYEHNRVRFILPEDRKALEESTADAAV